jgi:hypothetical protein
VLISTLFFTAFADFELARLVNTIAKHTDNQGVNNKEEGDLGEP